MQVNDYRVRTGALTALVHHQNNARSYIVFDFLKAKHTFITLVYHNDHAKWQLATLVLEGEQPRNQHDILEWTERYLEHAEPLVFGEPHAEAVRPDN